jgi:hypothetical protein
MSSTFEEKPSPMYTPVGSSEIIDRVEHIRELHRQIHISNERERILHQRREQKIKDFISNLRRTNARPTANMVRDMEEACSLTTDGAYRLFGFELDGVREFDLHLNGGRTRIVESYVFERDLMVELPLELAPAEAFRRNATLSTLVLRWQSDFPVRVLDRPGWRRPGAFYVQVGTEDSLGSSLPPGAMALVEPIDDEEVQRPNPRFIYLLQFRNGYRCSRCVVTRGKLQLLTSDRSYYGPQEFSYPTSVRIVGRVAVFTLGLPLQEYSYLGTASQYDGSANLILPWENRTRHSLFATKQRRFVRTREEKQYVEEMLQMRLHSKLSDRTRRRYRRETDSEPHIAALIQMTVEHYARYSDSLQAGGYALRDTGRFSLETMLRTKRFADLSAMRSEPTLPTPSDVWEARRKEIVEWSALLSLKFPRPSVWGRRVIRVGEEARINGLEPRIRAGAWMLLEELPAIPDTRSDASKHGWSRPLYALSQGLETVFGHLERDGSSFVLLTHRDSPCARVMFQQSELPNLRRVCGVLGPV